MINVLNHLLDIYKKHDFLNLSLHRYAHTAWEERQVRPVNRVFPMTETIIPQRNAFTKSLETKIYMQLCEQL